LSIKSDVGHSCFKSIWPKRICWCKKIYFLFVYFTAGSQHPWRDGNDPHTHW